MSKDSLPVSRLRHSRVTPQRETEILSAALDVLREAGYEALSMDVVAARARCGNATLYRQWHGKAGMITAALLAAGPGVDGIDTGSLRGDLVTLAQQLAHHAAKDTRLCAAISHALLADEDLALVARTAMQPRVDHVVWFLDRAIERGELPLRPAATEFLPPMVWGLVLSPPPSKGRSSTPTTSSGSWTAAFCPRS